MALWEQARHRLRAYGRRAEVEPAAEGEDGNVRQRTRSERCVAGRRGPERAVERRPQPCDPTPEWTVRTGGQRRDGRAQHSRTIRRRRFRCPREAPVSAGRGDEETETELFRREDGR